MDDNTGKKAMRPLVKNSQSQGQEEQGDRRGSMTDVHGGKQEGTQHDRDPGRLDDGLVGRSVGGRQKNPGGKSASAQ